MRDLIDERNFREKSKNSIIKGYNVHFMTKEELDAQKAKEAGAQAEEGAGMAERAAGNTQDKQEEKELSVREREHVTEEQIRKILGEREERIAKAFEEHSPDKNVAVQETAAEAGGTQDAVPANDTVTEEVVSASDGTTAEEVVPASDGTIAQEAETASVG